MEPILITTKNENTYLYSPRINRVVHVVPLFSKILYKYLAGISLHEVKCRLRKEGFQKDEINYYIKRLLIFEKNGYLDHSRDLDFKDVKITAEYIGMQIPNIESICLEITEACNMACTYCCYGDLYDKNKNRNNRNLNFAKVKILLDFMTFQINDRSNLSTNRIINLGFYGGEPLLNFDLIQKTVNYSSKLNLINSRFSYQITTNGLLLDKHMDYLVNENFKILISLDGDENCNSHRLDKKGFKTFDKVYENLNGLKSNYPDYFDLNVNFNSVLNNNTDVLKMLGFFQEVFGKVPRIADISTNGLREDKKAIFNLITKPVTSTIISLSELNTIESILDDRSPKMQTLVDFIFKYLGYSYENYHNLFTKDTNITLLPTGTCFPLSNKIFVSADAKIHLCEKIGLDHPIGYISDSKVDMNLNEAANLFNSMYSKVAPLCKTCYINNHCKECFFNMKQEKENLICNQKMDSKKFKEYFKNQIEILENQPQLYSQIQKNYQI